MNVREILNNAIVGLTVSILSLPMAIAFGVASGLGPSAGLYAAIIGGFMASLFGGRLYCCTTTTSWSLAKSGAASATMIIHAAMTARGLRVIAAATPTMTHRSGPDPSGRDK